MYKGIQILSGMLLASAAAATVLAGTDLPKVMILGRSYYCYEAKKGESLFNVATRYGWDPKVVAELNPNLVSPLSKGDLIYYPSAETSASEAMKSSKETGAPVEVTHRVVNGETVYSIARTYDIAMDQLYALNPSARKGIKAGETLLISKGEEREPEEYVYHTVDEDDTVSSLARQYDTTVEDLYKANPGLTPGELAEGTTVRLKEGTRQENVRSEISTEERLEGFGSYKVRKGDTWASVARKHNVDQQLLRDANPGKWKLRKNDIIAIPKTKEVEVELTYVEEDPREQTAEGRRELYDEVHGVESASSTVAKEREVRVAMVLEDVSSNRDMEFSRGSLLAIDRLKDSGFRTVLKIIDGSMPMSRNITELETFQPELIVSTADKELPEYLSDFARRTGAQLVNAFDVKSEAYIDNPSIYQFLTPTPYFNDEVRDFVADNYGGYTLLIAGSPASSDQMGEAIIRSYDDGSNVSSPINVEIGEIAEYPAEDFGKYIVYGTPTRKEDVSELLDAVTTLSENHPTAEIVLMGRPNWITYSETMRQKLNAANAMIPSRFYFDPKEPESRRFIVDYQSLFGQTPMKSYPVYSAAGYDIMTYFLPNTAMSDGDINATYSAASTLQSDVSRIRVSNWGGMINPNCYVITFNPLSEPRRIILPEK